MKIFVIHSFSNKEKIKPYVDQLQNKTTDTEIIMLDKGTDRWKLKARKSIKAAHLVLVFLGEKTHESKNVEWEIKRADDYKKRIITVKLNENNQIHPALLKKRAFRNNPQSHKDMEFDDLIEYVNCFKSGDYGLYNEVEDNATYQKNLFEQYKIFLQTSESLVLRRQSVNTFYISVNSAIFSLATAIFVLADDIKWKCFSALSFAFVGIIMCVSWARILHSYGSLNASKMTIISILEKKLPANLYDAEWRALADRLNFKPYISFTKSEVRIPKLFGTVYALIVVLSTALLIYTSSEPIGWIVRLVTGEG